MVKHRGHRVLKHAVPGGVCVGVCSEGDDVINISGAGLSIKKWKHGHALRTILLGITRAVDCALIIPQTVSVFLKHEG